MNGNKRRTGRGCWLLAAALLMSAALPAVAGNYAVRPMAGMPGMPAMQGVEISGPFDGVNLKRRRIWIDDTVFSMSRKLRVVGTSKKLGLLSDLRQGEAIKALVTRGEDKNGLREVLEIRRQ
ncbi:hypothetical protein [endosymbiont of Ridgeia piscesae]|jgi:hypothetical protein|uniref:Uncharacterized protein n=1 Tax=endosymbiont of Ridgeia piscesae TaxID=54398 RepID=A0A0T5YXS5_9GAMM|nr:hypothetical protein [endosymbiont of Ridgeia piscesae]KRT55384.1 hypothetical protein Ga0074115_11741 [endosymbiont of Ridgeia piscesae]KRT59782.1 hypothetical protein Ga0076813_159923 [endosymbiont of Ridgeia piscesae]